MTSSRIHFFDLEIWLVFLISRTALSRRVGLTFPVLLLCLLVYYTYLLLIIIPLHPFFFTFLTSLSFLPFLLLHHFDHDEPERSHNGFDDIDEDGKDNKNSDGGGESRCSKTWTCAFGDEDRSQDGETRA